MPLPPRTLNWNLESVLHHRGSAPLVKRRYGERWLLERITGSPYGPKSSTSSRGDHENPLD